MKDTNRNLLAFLLVTFALLAAGCQTVTPRTWSLPPGVKTLQVNGYDMAYVERGSGTAVVLVHGTTLDYRYWGRQMEPLSRSYRVIAPSLRHYYPEPWNGEGSDLSVEQHARDLIAFIEALNVGPVHLVGHSRGGDVALLVAKTRSDLLISLTLADPAPLASLLPQTPEAAAESNARNQFVRAALERLRQGDVDGGLETFIDGTSGAGAWQKLPEPQRQTFRDNAWTIKSLLTDAQTPFTCEDAATIKVPVLQITGERSARPYGVMHDALAACLRHSRKVTIPHAAHPMNLANPQAFNAAVLEFFAKPQ